MGIRWLKINFSLKKNMSEELRKVNKNIKNFKSSFNKKKWREQRYSTKTKVQKWENIKRKQAQRQFTKESKKVGPNLKSSKEELKYDKIKSLSTLKKAQLNFREKQKINEEKRNEQKRIENEKNKAMKAYKEKKAMRFRKLSQKTTKGQPLMRTRIELLLEKIQREYANYNS